MKQTIIDRYGKQFKQIFNASLNDYIAWHGFDLFKFEDHFVPENKDSLHFSMYDLLSAKYNEEAANLIRAILNYQSPTITLNAELEGLENGEEREFVIVTGFSSPGNVLMRKEKNVKGNIYFPFAIHEEGGRYTVTHLPTGYAIGSNGGDSVKLYSRAEKVLSMLREEFADTLYTTEYSQETYDLLQEKLKELQ